MTEKKKYQVIYYLAVELMDIDDWICVLTLVSWLQKELFPVLMVRAVTRVIHRTVLVKSGKHHFWISIPVQYSSALFFFLYVTHLVTFIPVLLVAWGGIKLSTLNVTTFFLGIKKQVSVVVCVTARMLAHGSFNLSLKGFLANKIVKHCGQIFLTLFNGLCLTNKLISPFASLSSSWQVTWSCSHERELMSCWFYHDFIYLACVSYCGVSKC